MIYLNSVNTARMQIRNNTDQLGFIDFVWNAQWFVLPFDYRSAVLNLFCKQMLLLEIVKKKLSVTEQIYSGYKWEV